MTPTEFKAWFEGFTEAMDRPPTKEQWARIKKRVAEIDGKPTTEPIFIDRYWPIWRTYPCCTTSGTSWNTTSAIPLTFNVSSAMMELGRVDYISTGAMT